MRGGVQQVGFGREGQALQIIQGVNGIAIDAKLAELLLLSIHITLLPQRHPLCTSHTRLSGVVVARRKSRLGRLDAVGLALLALVVIFGASQVPPSSSLVSDLVSSRLGYTVAISNLPLQPILLLLLCHFGSPGK